MTLFKSDSHMSQDGPKLPNARVWRQIIEDCRPKWVITTGTAGAIGADDEVGDVLVSRFVTFDCQRKFARLDGESFACPTDAPDGRFADAKSLFSFNAEFLPPDNTRPPNIVVADAAPAGVLTTDFFGFDNSDDTYKLQGKGGIVEMGDAVLGMVCQELGGAAPDYVAVRNASDPQIKSDGLSLSQQGLRALEHRVQRDRLLGDRRRGVSPPVNRGSARAAPAPDTAAGSPAWRHCRRSRDRRPQSSGRALSARAARRSALQPRPRQPPGFGQPARWGHHEAEGADAG
jgi:hypothetical protein